jgi:phasin family protein
VNNAKALAAAKTPQELFELQSGFAKSYFEAYVSEVGKISEIWSASFKESFAPINARVSDVVGKLQAVR